MGGGWWIPAFAGMTRRLQESRGGTRAVRRPSPPPRASPARFAPLTRAPLRCAKGAWVPACAGMTGVVAGMAGVV